MTDRHYAHTKEGRPQEEWHGLEEHPQGGGDRQGGRLQEGWHGLEEHLRNAAKEASAFAGAFDAAEWGELAGLWHDLGKYSEAFQEYLRISSGVGGDGHKSEVAGRVTHSTAGARHAVRRLGPLGRLLAYAIAGHHAGLPDNEGGDSSLRSRLRDDDTPFAAAPPTILDRAAPALPQFRGVEPGPRRGFALGFFTRMVFSCLVDADFLDTERFMAPERATLRPDTPPGTAALLERLERHLAGLQGRADTPVNRHRREVLAACREKAALPPGFFSLNVPTGGGKTLSSLAFALAHAQTPGLRRVVYAIPFTSIIEQAAEVFRAALGDLSDAVLEHHSSLDPDDPARQSLRSRLAAENFDAPVVVTTNVQLFESLFADRPSRCRKLHRLARSVIVLDEAQTVPPTLLAPTLAALKELVNNYGTTVVLCTATQPAIERRDRFEIGLADVRPIIDDPARLHDALRRTTVEVLGPRSNAELARSIRDEPQVLCIVNSRRHAADLYRELSDDSAFHLSASMCAAHRSEVLATVRRRLGPGRKSPCRVISTQVIEAGVDVDFPAVYRAVAGLDSIAQAAGRCNREGLLVFGDGRPRLGRVFVFEYDEREYPTVPMIRRAAECFREVAPDHRDDPLSPAAVEAYFRLFYWQQGGDGRGWDRGADGRSVMDCFATDPKDLLHAQFREASLAYRLIDDAQTPVIVPHGDRGRDLIRELELLPEDPEPSRLRAFDRAAQRHVVGVFDRGLKTLVEHGVLLERHGRFYLGNREAYDGRLGLHFDALGLDLDRTIV